MSDGGEVELSWVERVKVGCGEVVSITAGSMRHYHCTITTELLRFSNTPTVNIILY